MKFYTITVNGNTYQVSVEENNGSVQTAAPVTSKAPVVSQPTAPAQPAAPKPAVAPAASTVGSVKVNAPMPGKIIALKVTPGQTVKKGDVLLILEAMKMENEIVASQEGTVASLNVAVGQTVEAGDLLATLN